MAVLASALVTLPAGLAADVAVHVVNTADSSPLNVPNPPAPHGSANVPSSLGATGATAHSTQLSDALVHEAQTDPNALSTGAGPQADLPSGPLGIPGVVLDAYEHAQQVMAVQDPGCQLPWWLLAGIGRIESNQAEHGEVDSNGTTLRPILGPELNGSNGFAAIPAILGGEWTGDPVWQRAVGPMQFLPSTWLVWGDGGNPNNVYDSALAAGRYLCSGGGNLLNPAAQAAAVFSYNHSNSYVQIVLVWANAYRNGVTPLPETTVVPEGPMPSGQQTVGTQQGAVPTTPGTGPGSTTQSATQTGTSTSPTSGGATTSSGPPATGATQFSFSPPPATPARSASSAPTTTSCSAPPTTTTTAPPTTTTTTEPPTTTTEPPTTTTAPPTTTTTAPPTTTTDC